VYLNEFLFLAAFLFCTGVYGVLARSNGVLVLMSIELILNAVNINLVAFGAFRHTVAGQVFALFVIAVASRSSCSSTATSTRSTSATSTC
jgi:NADH:ubiquinone oxidoreductase subunit K